jgi:hypothetical protein
MKQDYDIVPIPISIRRKDGRYAYVNKAWSEMFSEGMEEVIGRTDRDLSLDPLAIPQGESNSMTGEYSFRDIYITTRNKGRLLLELIEIHVGAGTADEGIMCVHQDMTGIGWRMEDISRSLERSEYKIRECTQNLVRLTSEISGPVEEINQCCEKLGGSNSKATGQNWIMIIRDNAKVIQKTVQCGFDASILKDNVEDTPLVPVKIDELVSEVCTLYAGLAKDRNILLTKNIGEGMDKPVVVHCSGVHQILVNMLDCSIRGSKSGKIEICATMLEGTERPLCLKTIIEKPTDAGVRAGMGISQKIIRGLCGVIGGRFEICAEADGSKIMRVYLRISRSATHKIIH